MSIGFPSMNVRRRYKNKALTRLREGCDEQRQRTDKEKGREL